MSALPPQDPSSPGAVAGATFPVARKGFDPASVREYLRQVSQELSRALNERDRLSRELDEARAAAQRTAPEDLDEATVAAKLGEEAGRVLSMAHEASAQIRARAEESASRLLRDAELDAARQRGDAEVEAARRRQEAQETSEAEIEAAKAEGREMVAEARAVRERIFGDLTRRRDRAQEQIEALQASRERIMGALLGARRELDGILAAVEAHAPPEEEDEELPLEIPQTGPTPGSAAGAALVLGEMDVPAAIVERHVGVEPPAAIDFDLDDEPGDLGDDGLDDLDDDLIDELEVDVSDEVEVEVEVVPLALVPMDEAEPITAEVPAVDASAADAGASDDDQPSVDDLFARLRASSSETVARDVLAGEVVAATQSGSAEEASDDSAGESPGSDLGPSATLTTVAGSAAIARRKAALAPIRTALARQLKRVLADEQNDVLDRLRQRNASIAVDAVLGPVEAHPGTYREAAEDQVWAAASAGAHALSDLEGEELHAALEARSVLDRCLDTLEAELVVPLRARLVENLEASGDATEASGLIRATYREWKGRIDELGEDLVRTAYGRASYAVLAPGFPVCWVFDPSGSECPDAEDNVLAGAVAAGEPFPTGHRYAPAYRGCRCLLVADPG